MGKLKTDARRINRTTSSGLLVEALARNNEVTTVEARVNTKANAVAHFQNNPSKMANHPPHKPELNRFCVVNFASHREMATPLLSNFTSCHAIRLCKFCLFSFPCSRCLTEHAEVCCWSCHYGHPFVFSENPSLDLRLCTKIDINGPIWFWELGVSDLVQIRVANSFPFFSIWRFQETVPVFTNGESSSSVRRSRDDLD
jgi:hypothetical protein